MFQKVSEGFPSRSRGVPSVSGGVGEVPERFQECIRAVSGDCRGVPWCLMGFQKYSRSVLAVRRFQLLESISGAIRELQGIPEGFIDVPRILKRFQRHSKVVLGSFRGVLGGLKDVPGCFRGVRTAI